MNAYISKLIWQECRQKVSKEQGNPVYVDSVRLGGAMDGFIENRAAVMSLAVFENFVRWVVSKFGSFDVVYSEHPGYWEEFKKQGGFK